MQHSTWATSPSILLRTLSTMGQAVVVLAVPEQAQHWTESETERGYACKHAARHPLDKAGDQARGQLTTAASTQTERRCVLPRPRTEQYCRSTFQCINDRPVDTCIPIRERGNAWHPFELGTIPCRSAPRDG